MAKTIDFGQSLLAALRLAHAAREETALFVKAALALRAWYRHTALQAKPELIVAMSDTGLEVYGGARIVKAPTGELTGYQARPWLTAKAMHIELSAIGRHLAGQARRCIQEDYLEKALQFIQQSVEPIEVESLQQLLKDAHVYTVQKLNIPWWRPKCTEAADARVLGKLIWDQGLIDREAFGLAVRLYGFRFDLEDYNRCLVHRQEIKERIKEAPHMAAWLFSRHDLKLRTHETVWQGLRETFLAFGGTAQAWRWLCQQGAKWFHAMPLQPSQVLYITELASLQLGKIPYHRSLVMGCMNRNGDQRYLDVLKAALVAYRKRQIKVDDFQDCTLIFDHLHNVPTARTQGATWASLMRRQRVWHDEQVREAAARRKETNVCYGWAPLSRDFVQGKLEAISLNDSDVLWEEGDAMRHCVGTYDEFCYQNTSRIYSIRREGERVATLEIRFANRKWSIGQLFGVRNARIKDAAVTRLANQVLRACQRAPALKPEQSLVLRQPTHVKETLPAWPWLHEPAAIRGMEELPF